MRYFAPLAASVVGEIFARATARRRRSSSFDLQSAADARNKGGVVRESRATGVSLPCGKLHREGVNHFTPMYPLSAGGQRRRRGAGCLFLNVDGDAATMAGVGLFLDLYST